VLQGQDKQAVMMFINNIKKNCTLGTYELDDIALRQGLQVEPVHTNVYVRAMHYGNKYLKCNYTLPAKLKVLYVQRMPQGLPPAQAGAIAYENAAALPADMHKYINWQKMFALMFDSKVERLAAAMGWNGGKQATLVMLRPSGAEE